MRLAERNARSILVVNAALYLACAAVGATLISVSRLVSQTPTTGSYLSDLIGYAFLAFVPLSVIGLPTTLLVVFVEWKAIRDRQIPRFIAFIGALAAGAFSLAVFLWPLLSSGDTSGLGSAFVYLLPSLLFGLLMRR